MLPSKRRIKKESFTKILKDGYFVHGDSLYLRLLDRNDGLSSLFSFIVPAKIVKTSVERHAIKRKMTSVVEKVISGIKPGYSCLFFLKKKIVPLTFNKLEKEILILLEKSKMLN